MKFLTGVLVGVLALGREESMKPCLKEDAGLVIVEAIRRFDINHGGVINGNFIAPRVRDNDDGQCCSGTEIFERSVQYSDESRAATDGIDEGALPRHARASIWRSPKGGI